MKKLFSSFIFIITVIAISTQVSTAQLFEKGKKVADGGLYFPSSTTILKAGVSYGIADNIGAGIEARYFSSSVGVFGKVNYDFAPSLNLGDKVFLYGGGKLGSYFGGGKSQFAVLGQLGGGYMFNEKIGANAEVEFGIINGSGSQFGLGIVYKLD